MYCGKWRKISKSRRDLDLDQTMPNVEHVRAIFIYYKLFKFKWIDQLFFELSCTQLHTHTQTDRKTHRQTDRHDYSIVAVDKPQL